MIIKAPTWKQLIATLRQLELGRTKGFIKKHDGVWEWRKAQ